MFVFKDFKKNFKFVHPADVEIDNIFFRLHYRVTFWFLMACCLLVSSKQFIRDHINCITDKYLANVVDTFCFFSTTFTVVKYHNSTLVDNHFVPHPGVGPFTDKDKIVYHSYYQWVPFVLFFQALMFYVPHKIWKHSDNRRLASIVHRMKSTRLVSDEERVINNVKIDSHKSRSDKAEWLSQAYVSISRLRVCRDWARMLVVCEFLNAVNMIGQMWLTDDFLQHKFLTLGVRWLHGDDNALDEVFPKVTKCTFHKYGPTGTIQVHDTMCIMSLNIINEKIYLLLWFWFIALFIITLTSLFWRFLSFVLHNRSYAFNKLVWGEVSPGPAIYAQDIEILTRELYFSDWLFLYYIGKNVDGKLFRTAVSQVAAELSRNKPGRLIKFDNSIEDDPKESDC